MHPDEIDVEASLVRGMLEVQFPDWGDLPLKEVFSAGTDNTLFRLGNDLLVRLPRVPWAQHQPLLEYRWLPILAPHLPLLIPTPTALGNPTPEYPFPWLVCDWLDGWDLYRQPITDWQRVAYDLGKLLVTFRQIPTEGGPLAGPQNHGRGVPLAERDSATRSALALLTEDVDTILAVDIWERALAAPVWDRSAVWVHGDIQPGNLLATDGRISATIDFGCLGVGDPAVDLIVAWNLLPASVRPLFRESSGVDAATWERGRGWALSIAAIALPYYRNTNPLLALISRTTLDNVLNDFTENG